MLVVAATDRRVRAVVSQVPTTDGWANFRSLVPTVMLPLVHAAIAADRRLELVPGPHFAVYEEQFDRASGAAREFLLEHLGARE